MNKLEVNIFGEPFQLHPFRAMYWGREKALLISDLHLGKVAHFRKAGIPVPSTVSDHNWDRLLSLLIDWQPERVIFLGDLFHSNLNTEWADFCKMTGQFAHVKFELVPGNHDILHKKHYMEARLYLHKSELLIDPFILSHHPLHHIPDNYYNLCGHLHPSVRLKGSGRQRLKLPCFYFTQNQGIMPAFGAFTGTAEVQPRNGDRVFIIAQDRVVEMK